MTTSGAAQTSLRDFASTIALVGAGKMGSAMLDGWISLGLDPARVAVIEPQPSPAIAALAARGLKLNPDQGMVRDPAVVVIAVNEAGRDFGLSAGSLVSVAAKALGGNGGGKPDVAQGGGAPLSDRHPGVVNEAFEAVGGALRDIAGSGR